MRAAPKRGQDAGGPAKNRLVIQRPECDDTVVRLSSVSKTFNGRPVLQDVSFVLQPGRCYGLVGPNGTGKTTTMRILLGLVGGYSGEALVWGVPYQRLGGIARGRVGVSLDPSAVPRTTTVESWFGFEAHRRSVSRSRARRGLTNAGLLPLARRQCGLLSAGEKQRLAIATALLARPQLVILDEPTLGLDIDGLQWLRRELRALVRSGGTVLVSSHALDELRRTADHLILMDRGRVVADRPLAEVVDSSAYRVRAADPTAVARVAASVGAQHDRQDDGSVVVHGVDAREFGDALFRSGVPVHELAPMELDLTERVKHLREHAEVLR